MCGGLCGFLIAQSDAVQTPINGEEAESVLTQNQALTLAMCPVPFLILRYFS
jgi:hypothetical protein